jgi:argininosuccinate lyase
MAAMIENTAVNTGNCSAAAGDPSLLATDLADWLVRKGMPFRRAHHVVGAAVGVAEQLGVPLNRLTLKQLRKIDPLFEVDALAVFDLNKALARRNIVGAPAPRQVARQLARWRKTLSNR